MKKIALCGKFNAEIRNMFREQIPENFEVVEFENGEELGQLVDVDYMICRGFPITEGFLSHTPFLRLVQKWGAGYDKIDIQTAGARGISVAVCWGGNSSPVAEMTVLLMLSVYRNIIPLYNKLKEGDWARERYMPKSYTLNGKIVGFLGFGSIGQKTAKILKRGFDAHIQYYDLQRLPEEKETALGLRYADMDDLLRTSDIISIHVPLLESTKNIINKETLVKMKSSAIVINTSRGGVIDEYDLYEALRDNIIAGAGLDTMSIEPVDPSCPLLKLENVVLTPHCGGNTADNDINMVKYCVENVVQYDRDGFLVPPVLVNKNYLKASCS
ncbi:MAG: 2-hydroxyacid dehydrogenase [Synergistaceae bacterium]|jgi:phosphoglycerate dehydrogenase-like enzyme|nr:2-hydroxyacid dehydrogenase [Synergistaceae bacterium]